MTDRQDTNDHRRAVKLAQVDGADPRRRPLLTAGIAIRSALRAIEAATEPAGFARSLARSDALAALRAAERTVEEARRAFEASIAIGCKTPARCEVTR